MKFLVPNYSCLQNPWVGATAPQIPVLSLLCPQLNLLKPPRKKSWERHCWLHLGHLPAFYRRFSQNCETRFLASSCLSDRPCAWTVRQTDRQTVDGLSRNTIFENFSKIFRDNSGFIKIRQDLLEIPMYVCDNITLNSWNDESFRQTL